MKRNAADEIGVALQELAVPFVGGAANGGVDAVLRRVEGSGDEPLEEGVEGRYSLEKVFELGVCPLEDFGVFERCDIAIGGPAREETFAVVGPPVFGGEFDDVFTAVIREAVDLHTSFSDKVVVPADVAGAKEVLPFLYNGRGGQ